ncbi:MAG: DUF4178 domain-containing protein [Thiolinea sp.]
MTADKIRSIKCTSCAAPLTLYGGGHKVRTINCEFCGAVMDARKHFTLLHQFSEQQRPDIPLQHGMQGKINGIDFIIIGTVVWEDTEGYRWTDLMLFSATHGYAWLTLNQGHLVFSRRTRDIPDVNVWNLAPKYEFTAGSGKYKFFERYRAKIVYVAGELTWIAKKDDSSHFIEAIAPPYMYEVEHNGSEIEYGLGEYMEDAEAVYSSFGITEKPAKPQSVHPAQPYRSKFLEPLSKAALPFTAIAGLLLVITNLFFGGSEIYSAQVSADELRTGSNHVFTVTRPGRLVELTLDTQLRNAWGYFDIDILQGANDVFSFGTGASFYEGTEGGEYWAEGDRTAYAYFQVPQAGEYTMHIQMTEGGTGETGTTPPDISLQATLKQGYISNYYFNWLFVIAAIAALAGFFSKMFFEGRRWKSVLGDDDE